MARSKLFQLRSYNAWRAMSERCANPNHEFYSIYGGAGVRVCAEWKSYSGFVASMGEPEPGMQIDRIDPARDYCPENCRWATPSQNMANRRSWSALGLKGVFKRPSGRFGAVIRADGGQKVLGTFDDPLDAARAFDAAAIARFGEFAFTNARAGKIPP